MRKCKGFPFECSHGLVHMKSGLHFIRRGMDKPIHEEWETCIKDKPIKII